MLSLADAIVVKAWRSMLWRQLQSKGLPRILMRSWWWGHVRRGRVCKVIGSCALSCHQAHCFLGGCPVVDCWGNSKGWECTCTSAENVLVEKAVVIKTNDVVFPTWHDGVDGAQLLVLAHPLVDKASTCVGDRGGFRAMAVFGHVRVGWDWKMWEAWQWGCGSFMFVGKCVLCMKHLEDFLKVNKDGRWGLILWGVDYEKQRDGGGKSAKFGSSENLA